MVSYVEKVIGFDVRELWLEIDAKWPKTARERHLLNPNVVKPLSVDHFIWHSIFSEGVGDHVWAKAIIAPKYRSEQWHSTFRVGRELSMPDIPAPKGIWSNLQEMISYTQSKWGDYWKPSAVVAVTELFEAHDIPDDEYYFGVPRDIDPKWKLLGFDVADYDLITGLMNSSEETEDAKTKEEWKPYLNEHHLFNKFEDALRFIDTAARRNPSHAPYWVYGLYLIDKMNVDSNILDN